MSTTRDPPMNLLQLGNNIHAALRHWSKDDSGASPLNDLFLYRSARRKATSDRQASNAVLYEGINTLAARFPEHAKVLRLRFLDGKTAYAVANQLNVAESKIYALQKEALEHLAETLWSLDQQARYEHADRQLSRIEPATYVELVGVASHLDQLENTILTPGPPWIVLLEGLGGVGKTALADALVRRLVSQAAFDEFGWVTARRIVFSDQAALLRARPAMTDLMETLLAQLAEDAPPTRARSPQRTLALLRDHLHRPHLIVIDNLDAVRDIENLLPTFRHLGGPSKFVLISRESLLFEPGVRHFAVHELSEHDALQLVRLEARLRGLPELESASDQALQPIYETVGGNPLALRLVIGQVFANSLEGVLLDLANAQGKKASDLFTYIYRQAWDRLDQASRTVFAGMLTFVESGCTAQELASSIDVALSDAHDGLETLVALNLVDCCGGLHDKRFTIHNLTRQFLQQQVTKWQ